MKLFFSIDYKTRITMRLRWVSPGSILQRAGFNPEWWWWWCPRVNPIPMNFLKVAAWDCRV